MFKRLRCRPWPLLAPAAVLILSAGGGSARSGPARSQDRAGQDPLLVLTAARLLDVASGAMLDDAAMVVRGNRIVAVGRRTDLALPPDARRLDLGNMTLLPGLIDAHVHLTLAGAPRANAEATLRAGFTTVQDLGALGYVNQRLRDSIRAGRRVGPRIVSAGPWLGMTGGTCDFNGIGVHDRPELLQRVRDDAAHGVDAIKVCVTGWIGDALAGPERRELADDDLAAVVTEARGLGRRVVAHAIGGGGARGAVHAGVAGLAHAAFLDDETAALMRERRVYLASTLTSLEAQGDTAAYVELWRRMQRALAHGVPIILGTDAGVVPHGSNAREFAALVRLGMSPINAVRAGTLGAARALGLADSLGSLEVGKLADVVAVPGNPLNDISVLERVAFVLGNGVVARDDVTPTPGGRRP